MLKALIVDDDAEFVSRLQFHMEHPYTRSSLRFSTVDIAYNCRDAVQLAEENQDYDLVVYDLRLPEDDVEQPSREKGINNGLQLVRDIAPLQRSACGILVSGELDIQVAFLVGKIGAVSRLIPKTVGPQAILLTAQEAMLEAAQRSQAVFERLNASYQSQAKVHEAMNGLNNILAAAGEVEKMCASEADFVPSRHLPIVREEMRHIRTFQETAEAALRSIRPAQSGRRELCDLRKIAEWCVRHQATLSAASAQKLTLNVDSGVPPTFAIFEELQQIMLMLTTNALQAVGDHGRVQLSIRFAPAEGRDIVIEVLDDGRGIPVELRERIFDPDYSSRPGGGGQGLFLARAFAWNHGGRIQVSDGVGGIGTRVTVTLPLRGVHAGE